jgi:hypothetical protein
MGVELVKPEPVFSLQNTIGTSTKTKFKHFQNVIIRETTPPKNKNYVEVVDYQELSLHLES